MQYYQEHGMEVTVNNFYKGLNKAEKKTKKRQIYKWLGKKTVILNAVARGRGLLQKNREDGLSTVLGDEDEELIAHWVRDLRRESVPVSPFMLESKANEVAEDSGIAAGSFSATDSWKKRFLSTYRLSLRRKTRIGQITPANSAQVAQQFRLDVLGTLEAEGIVEVYNADRTAMNYEYLPTRTYEEKGTRTVWIHNAGSRKKRMTVTLLGDMHGKRRTPFAVFKQPPSKVTETEIYNHKYQNGFGRGVWAEVAPLMEKHDVQIYANAKGWWNAELSIIFLRYHFGSRDSLGEKVLLLWDDFSGHWTECVKEYAASINVVLMKIPPGYTSSCQPADIAWMKPFKLQLRSLWVEHLQSQLRKHQDSGKQIKFKLVAPLRPTLMSWLTNAWEILPTASLASGFRKLAIPTDTRELAEVVGLVEKLESLHVAVDVGDDLGLECSV